MDNLIPLLSTAVGALAAVGGTFLTGAHERRRDALSAQRERDARQQDDSREREARRRDFQLRTLLELQDGVQRLGRLTSMVLQFDLRQAREGQYTLIPDDLSDELQTRGIEVNRLCTRVLDHDVRRAVEGAKDRLAKLGVAVMRYRQMGPGSELEAAWAGDMNSLGDVMDGAMELMGVAIRHELESGAVPPS
ncbi:hypothetical protein [Promicromonospora sp. NFX87]|uniref:hypothetical protein n=1 Tax=Promicromonospora sp. NFX87 TaxID=3402691 RepID=UPI003AFB74A0